MSFSAVVLPSLFTLPYRHLWIRRVRGYLFDINQSTFISPNLWKPFMFSFSLCPHFIHYVSQTHTALSAFCCCCCLLFIAREQIAFCWVLLHQTSLKFPHALMLIQRNTCTYTMITHVFLFLFFVHLAWCLFEFVFLRFMFFWQQNGSSRFHGLASLDDITAIISTPPLGGFQVATSTSLISCSNATKLFGSTSLQFSVLHRYASWVICWNCSCVLAVQDRLQTVLHRNITCH